jgi:hypothetical protein
VLRGESLCSSARLVAKEQEVSAAENVQQTILTASDDGLWGGLARLYSCLTFIS